MIDNKDNITNKAAYHHYFTYFHENLENVLKMKYCEVKQKKQSMFILQTTLSTNK
jgi:hypothetical protein